MNACLRWVLAVLLWKSSTLLNQTEPWTESAGVRKRQNGCVHNEPKDRLFSSRSPKIWPSSWAIVHWTHNTGLNASPAWATHQRHAHKHSRKHFHHPSTSACHWRYRAARNVQSPQCTLLPSLDLLCSTVLKGSFPVSGRQATPVALSVRAPSRSSRILALGNLGLSRRAWLEPWLSGELWVYVRLMGLLTIVNPVASMAFLSLIFNHRDPFFFLSD